MRTRLTVDSATPAEVYNLTLAFQRTLGHGLPNQIQQQPQVQVLGSCMTWTSPALHPAHALGVMAEFARLDRGIFDGGEAERRSATVAQEVK